MHDTCWRSPAWPFLAGLLVLAPLPALAEDGTLLGVSKNWSAYTRGNGDDKICYAVSKPRASEPRKAKRDPVYLLINDFPAQHARAQPELVPGYKYKDSSLATVQVGSDKFSFFTQNDATGGGAWIKDPNDEARLVDALQRGAEAIVTGTSARGTLTRDTYSLGGLSDVLTKIHTACNM